MLNSLHIPIEFTVENGSYHIHIWGKGNDASLGTEDVVAAQGRHLTRYYAKNHEMNLALLHQVHGNTVVEARFEKTSANPDSMADADAMFAAGGNAALAIKTADCIPILFFHKRKLLYGAIHTGWKGLELNIFTKTLEEIRQDPKDFVFIIGPHIFQENYETNEDVFLRFPPEYSRPGLSAKKRYLSLTRILRNEMNTCKVDSRQIIQIPENTFGSDR
ncbi:MAG: polyphenol oxidase family protein, partial [Spirochaetia bacterium]|nr:polyphenol oxidase family protein [Spirochaetia bacterium]